MSNNLKTFFLILTINVVLVTIYVFSVDDMAFSAKPKKVRYPF